MKFELSNDFIRNSGLLLNFEDIRLGVALGFISLSTAIRVSVDAIEGGLADSRLQELAMLSLSNQEGVIDVLAIGDSNLIHSSTAKRKWLYFELEAAYAIRERLRDPLEVVEEIYADFGYPPSMEPFVRYMPVELGIPTGEPALYNKWEQYLIRERDALESLSRDGSIGLIES